MRKKFAIGTLLFLIAGGIFMTSAPSALAQGSAVVAPTEGGVGLNSPDYSTALENCGVSNWTACIVNVTHFLLVYLSAWFVSITARLLDFFIAYSIDTTSYSSFNEFIIRGWSIIRDIANVAFIFTLLYIAIRHILQAAHAGTKKLLTMLIVAALLINFSLFFTKVLVDAGNILARTFYNAVNVVNDNPDTDTSGKAISQNLASKVNPQTLFSVVTFAPVVQPGVSPADSVSYGWIFTIQVLTMIVNITMGVTFLSIFLLFLARVIGLWFLMIFSPLAFMSIAVPGAGSILGDFSWSKWLKQTISLSFMAPIVLFFIFLAAMFLEIVPTAFVSSEESIKKILAVIIPFLFVVVILLRAKSVAKDMSGKFGEALMGAAGKAFGFAVGAASLSLGAAGLAGRYTLGQAGRLAARSETLKEASQSKKWYAKPASFLRTTGNVASRSSFDARSTWVGKRTTWLAQQAASQAAGGGKISTKVFGFDTEKGAGKGGWRQMQKDTKKHALEKAEKRDISVDESPAYQNAMLVQAKVLEELKTNNPKMTEEELKEEIKKDQRYASAEKTIKGEKKKVEEINKSVRENQASWQERYFWQAGRREAAYGVRAGKKPEGEMEKLLKELRKKEKEEKEGKHGKDDHGGKHEEKPEKPSGGGVQAGAEHHEPAGGGGGHAPDHHGSADTRSVVGAIEDVGAKISKEGNLQRKRDMSESKAIGGLGSQIGSIGRGATINSEGGGITEERNLAGFGNRGTSTPNEGGSIGFKPSPGNNEETPEA